MKSLLALNARETVRGRLNVTGSARKDAIAKAREDLPSYTDADVEEITGQWKALTADVAESAANAAANAVADAMSHGVGESPVQVQHESPGGLWVYIIKHPTEVSAAIASIGAALVGFGHWVLGLF